MNRAAMIRRSASLRQRAVSPQAGTVLARSGLESKQSSWPMTTLRWYYAKLAAFSAFPTVPLLVPVGYYVGLPWLASAFAFIGIPLLDLLMLLPMKKLI